MLKKFAIKHESPYLIFFLILVLFSFFSYSQVDLNLTLSSNTTYQVLQQRLIWVGYFHRQLSALIFTLLILLFFILYLFFLKQAAYKLISNIKAWQLVIISAIIFIFAYPAFSHDIFNYMFDARIVTKYKLNPYYFRALDFPDDSWTRFMRWTHRFYPYGPLWLLITLPFSFLGFGKFTLTLFLFKLMFTFFYIGNSFLIKSIADKLKINSIFVLLLFALNPLILIESILSPHSEVLVLFFILLSFLLLLKRHKILSFFVLIVSGNIKFISWILLLPFSYFITKFRLEKNTYKRLTWWYVGFYLLILIPLIIYRQIYPWYLLPLIGLGTLLYESKIVRYLILASSLGATLRYFPYLLYGEQTTSTEQVANFLFFLVLTLSLIVFFTKRLRKLLNYIDYERN